MIDLEIRRQLTLIKKSRITYRDYIILVEYYTIDDNISLHGIK
jgi:hypothetical protein